MTEVDRCELPRLTIRDLLSEESAGLRLRLLAGRRGLDNVITTAHLEKPGLALAGSTSHVHAGGLQVLGSTEVEFLDSLGKEDRPAVLRALFHQKIASLVVADGVQPTRELREGCNKRAVPLLVTGLPAAEVIDQLSHFLDRRLAPRISIHGTLLDLHGLGILLLGESGVGKSECALDLITRGHRLVTDDVVEVHRVGEELVGMGPELTRYNLEVRGIGLLDVKDLFGVAAVRATKNLELVIRLEPWVAGKEYDRLGIDDKSFEILGVPLRLVEIPVAPGRNLATLTEVAARNELLKMKGAHAARELAGRLKQRLEAVGPDKPPRRAAGPEKG